MKLNNIKDVTTFLNTIDSCKGNVYFISQYGDKFNLKSKLSQYVAVAALLDSHGDELELFCDLKDDEYRLVQMFFDHPELG